MLEIWSIQGSRQRLHSPTLYSNVINRFCDRFRLAALAVFSCHFLYVFFPYLARGRTVDQSGFVPLWHWETWFARAPFTLLYNGDFAVAVFFVLSGYVLTRKFWNNGDVTSLTAGACLA